ncbi:MCRS1 protein, partial [Amia calva]|nr:MCRS1 protein [Amia calva]
MIRTVSAVEKALKASYKLAIRIAKARKQNTIAETLLMPVAIDAAPLAKATHCMLHRENLIMRKMPDDLKHVLDETIRVVNFIKAHPLNTLIFSIMYASQPSPVVSKSSSAPVPMLATVATPPPITKRVKKSKQPLQITKDLGRWKPTDDLLLINAVLQTTDLTAVHLGVKFSCRFNLREIQERWYALLYDPVISKLAWQAMRQLHPEAIAAIQSKALFSQAEEALLSKIPSTSQPKLEVFQELLNKHPGVFYPSRTAKSLLVHWQLLKHSILIVTVQPLPKGDQVLNFSDAEQLVDDAKLKESRDEVLEHELMIADRHQKREIRQLEQELPRWQVLVDSITGMSSPDFDNQTLAALRGRMVRYLMRSREITLGRATKDKQIDVDLSLEGPAWKISRKQGIIKLKNNGDFFIANEGRRPIYIDGRPVLSGNKWKLNNNSVVEVRRWMWRVGGQKGINSMEKSGESYRRGVKKKSS